MSRYARPATPATTERQLRQEAGFGCAKCGHPYIEYHHIIPFSEEKHFRPEDMLALCGKCHPAVALWGRDRQYALKADPHNIRTGRLNGQLEYDKRNLVFKVGGNWYEDTPVILQLNDTPIISCRLDDGQAKVTLNLMDQHYRPLLLIQDNNISFRADALWDFQYHHNYAVAHHGQRDIVLRLDFRKDEAVVEGKIWLGAQQVTLGRDVTTLPGGGTMRGCRVSAGVVAIQLGDEDCELPKYCIWPRPEA